MPAYHPARHLIVPAALAALLAVGGAYAGQTADGREWPPDPKVYAPPGTPVAPGLAIGDRLGTGNAAAAKDLLPPEVLRHYTAGEYENPIVSWPEGLQKWDLGFEEATRGNKGRYALQEGTRTIVEKATGKQAAYVYGLPFPDIAPDDPEGGIKALWNSYFAWWANGNTLAYTTFAWVGPGGLDRRADLDIRFEFFQGQAPKYRLPNPANFEVLGFQRVLSPVDLQGTMALSHRFHDPAKRDASWAYVPALRRVRAVSPANRSDGFLGSDLSQDDAHFFDGKPEDFVWKTIGVREGLRIVDPDSVRGQGGNLHYVADTDGFRIGWDRDIPAAGYLAPGKAFAWAPVSAALAKRRMWVVEGVPRDKYYLYGRIELWIDAETWEGAWNRKFSWRNELLNAYQVSAYLNAPVSRPGDKDVEWLWNSGHEYRCIESVAMNRATITGLRTALTAPLDRRVKHAPDTFTLNALARGGK